MANIAQIALRVWTFVFTLLALSLVGNVVDIAHNDNPSSVNYALFTAIFCMLVIVYGVIAAFVESLAIPIALLVADGLALLFSFVAGVVLAAKLGVHSCSDQYYLASNPLTNSSANMGKRCHELQASTAFFWFIFAGFAGSLILTAMGGLGGSSISTRRGGVRRGGPSMSQV